MFSNAASGLFSSALLLSSITNVAALWQPAVGASWQIVLINPIKTPTTSISPNVDIFDIDMFTNSNDTVKALHRLNKKVICYFSAGSYEKGRPDSNRFTKADKGSELEGWPGEYWLNVSSPNVRSIMADRIKYAARLGCDAIDPDNVDGYANKNGLKLTKQNAIDFMQFLAQQASAVNLSIGLKNAGEIIQQVLPFVQFSVNEQCHNYTECTTFSPFVNNGKPVFNIEYPDSAPDVTTADRTKYCSTSGQGAGSKNFSVVLKTMDLDGDVTFCNGASAYTPEDE